MGNDIYNQNIEFLYNKYQKHGWFYLMEQKEKLEAHVENFCFTPEEEKNYYISELSSIEKKVQNNIGENVYDLRYKLAISFQPSKITIDRSKFDKVVQRYIKIPTYLIQEKEQKINKEFNRGEINFKTLAEELKAINKKIDAKYLWDILKLSLDIKYLRHLIENDNLIKEDHMKIKNLPDLELYERYAILNKVLDFDEQLSKLKTSNKSKHNLLAISLNCSPDTAKHLFNGSYLSKLSSGSYRKDAVIDFIEKLQLED